MSLVVRFVASDLVFGFRAHVNGFASNLRQIVNFLQEIYHAMNETLFKIHDVDIDAVGLGDFGKRGKFVQSEQFTN